VLNDVFAWLIVPLIAVGRFLFITPMYWTLQNQRAIFSASTIDADNQYITISAEWILTTPVCRDAT
jgi:hypothetical protein